MEYHSAIFMQLCVIPASGIRTELDLLEVASREKLLRIPVRLRQGGEQQQRRLANIRQTYQTTRRQNPNANGIRDSNPQNFTSNNSKIQANQK